MQLFLEHKDAVFVKIVVFQQWHKRTRFDDVIIIENKLIWLLAGRLKSKLELLDQVFHPGDNYTGIISQMFSVCPKAARTAKKENPFFQWFCFLSSASRVSFLLRRENLPLFGQDSPTCEVRRPYELWMWDDWTDNISRQSPSCHALCRSSAALIQKLRGAPLLP